MLPKHAARKEKKRSEDAMQRDMTSLDAMLRITEHPFERRCRRTPKMLLATAAIGLLGSSFAAAQPLGFIMMRLYLPPEGKTVNVVPPTLVFEYENGTTKTILPCATQAKANIEMLRALAEKQTGCAWAGTYGVDGRRSLNVGGPDSSAKYWVTPFLPVVSLKRIQVKGQFPDARYLSFITYNSKFNTWLGPEDSPQLTDYEIVPDTGDVNPWQQSVPPGGKFTLNITRHADETGTNVLPMPPPEEGGFLDILKAMPPVADNCKTPGGPCVPYNVFLRPDDAVMNGMGPNRDSGYIMSRNNFDRGIVQVVHGKLPRVTQGTTAQPWLYSGNQLRYASFCTYPMMKPYPLGACLKDDDLALNEEGYYTVVVGAPADKPSSVTGRGDNWLPHYNRRQVDHMVVLRNMVPLDFPHSVHNVSDDGSPTSAANVMQEYYPQAKLCTVTSYELHGKDCSEISH